MHLYASSTSFHQVGNFFGNGSSDTVSLPECFTSLQENFMVSTENTVQEHRNQVGANVIGITVFLVTNYWFSVVIKAVVKYLNGLFSFDCFRVRPDWKTLTCFHTTSRWTWVWSSFTFDDEVLWCCYCYCSHDWKDLENLKGQVLFNVF